LTLALTALLAGAVRVFASTAADLTECRYRESFWRDQDTYGPPTFSYCTWRFWLLSN